MHHCFFIRIPRRIRPLHRSCGPLPPATRGKRRHISAFRNQGRYRLRFFEAHRYTACIGLVEQAGFEPTTCAERSRLTLYDAPTNCATAPCGAPAASPGRKLPPILVPVYSNPEVYQAHRWTLGVGRTGGYCATAPQGSFSGLGIRPMICNSLVRIRTDRT